MSQRTRRSERKANSTPEMSTDEGVSENRGAVTNVELPPAADSLTLCDLYALMIAINNNVNQMNAQLTEKVNAVATSIPASTAEVTDLQVKVKEQGDNITLLMPQSHIPDYGSRLGSDSATTRKVKKSDYYPQ